MRAEFLPGMPFPKTWAMRERRLRAEREAREAERRAAEAADEAETKANWVKTLQETEVAERFKSPWETRSAEKAAWVRRVCAKRAEVRFSLDTILEEQRSLILNAIAYRIDRRWKEYRSFGYAEGLATCLTDAEYIEAMFRFYASGRVRLL